MPNQLEKYMSFTINNRLTFIATFQFLDFLFKNFKTKNGLI